MRIKSTSKNSVDWTTAPTDSYKGFDHFCSALGHLDAAKYHICAFGASSRQCPGRLGFVCQRFGCIRNRNPPYTICCCRCVCCTIDAGILSVRLGGSARMAHLSFVSMRPAPEIIVDRDNRVSGGATTPVDLASSKSACRLDCCFVDDRVRPTSSSAESEPVGIFIRTQPIAILELYRSLVSLINLVNANAIRISQLFRNGDPLRAPE